MSDTVVSGAQVIRDVPSGELYGTDQYLRRDGQLKTRRGKMRLREGKSYEWLVGRKKRKN